MNSLAPKLKDIEQSHFGYQLGYVIRIMDDVIAQLASLEVLCDVGLF